MKGLCVAAITCFFLVGCQPVDQVNGANRPSGYVASSKQAAEQQRRLFAVYDQIQLGDTYQSVTKRLGEGTHMENKTSTRYYSYKQGSAGARVDYFQNGKVKTIDLSYDYYRELARFCMPMDKAKADQIRKGMSMREVNQLLGGGGVEVSRTGNQNGNLVTRMLLWCNSDESYIHCIFDAKDILISFKIVGFE